MKIDDSPSPQAATTAGRCDCPCHKGAAVHPIPCSCRLGRTGLHAEMVEAICRIPVTIQAEDSSLVDLVRRPGYLGSIAVLSNDVLMPYLREHPELIDAWLGYSSDKRTSSGWYFKQMGQETYEVGYFPRGERRSYTDAARACAEFIGQELREVWGHAG